MKEVRKWDEDPSGQVKGMETLITEVIVQIKNTDPLTLDKRTSHRNLN